MANVTWLLSVVNAMPYLPETMQSIHDQTYADAEVLAWDDGSTDGTLEELHRWIPHRIPGRIISDRRAPLGESLRQMLLEVDTPLCARIDGDDVNLPDRLKKQIDFLEAHPEVDVLGTQMVQINATGETISQNAPPLPGSHEKILFSLLCRNPFCHSAIVFKTRAVLDTGNYRHVQNVEDYDLWFRMAIAGYRFHNLPQQLVRRRVYEASLTQRSIQSGLQRARADACVIEHAPRLYGCSTAAVRKLRERAYLIGAIPIAAFLLRFAREHGQSALDLLGDPSVTTGWYYLMTPNDYASRTLIKAGSLLARAAVGIRVDA